MTEVDKDILYSIKYCSVIRNDKKPIFCYKLSGTKDGPVKWNMSDTPVILFK